MNKLVLSLMAATALAATVPALAQKAPDPKAPEAKTAPAVKIPKDTFYRGTGPTQYLARTKYLGQKVVGPEGQVIGDIEDIILGKDDKIDGFVLGVGGFLGVGEKKIGVRFDKVKASTKDGKTVLTLQGGTKEVLAALEPYNGQKSMVQKASDTVKDAAKKASDAAKGAYDKAKDAVSGKKEEPKKQ